MNTKRSLLPGSVGQRTIRYIRNLLFLAGVIALTYVGFTLLEAKLYQASANRTLATQIRSTESTHATESNATGSANATQAKPTTHSGDVLGRIDIPRLGLSVAVLQGTSSRVLRLGAGHIEDTPLPGEPGNSVVAGHRDTFFRGLKDIREHDEIQLQTATGVLRYEVDWMKIVGPEDTSALQSSGDMSTLTLVTCYPFYMVGPAPKRLVVHARKS